MIAARAPWLRSPRRRWPPPEMTRPPLLDPAIPAGLAQPRYALLINQERVARLRQSRGDGGIEERWPCHLRRGPPASWRAQPWRPGGNHRVYFKRKRTSRQSAIVAQALARGRHSTMNGVTRRATFPAAKANWLVTLESRTRPMRITRASRRLLTSPRDRMD